jgi:hypothetical protein
LFKPRMDAKRRELGQGCLEVCICATLSMTVDRPFAFIRVDSRFNPSSPWFRATREIVLRPS